MLNKLQAISDRLEAVVTQMEDPATYASIVKGVPIR